jgi:TRAP-type uncharacterized transport system substrate-binding protein
MSRPPARPRRARGLSAGSTRFALAVAAVAAALLVAIVLAARPGVPRATAMATGFRSGSYHRFALDYRAILARHGIALELRETRGAPENLALLDDPASGVQAAFVQSGVLNAGRTSAEGLRESVGVEHPDLVALGSVFHEPLWIFHRLPGDPELLSELAGRRIAVGSPDTATHVLVRQLLPVAGLAAGSFEALAIGGRQAVEALGAGKADAVMLTSHESSPLLAQLAAVPGVKLMSLAHAEALTRRFPWLARLTLPRGGLDLARDFPPREITLVSPTAALVARRDLHPAIVLMLLEAAVETHSEPGTFQRLHQFPSIENLELPIDPDARKYIAEGPSLLQEHLPFAVATLVRRLTVILPAAALLFSLLKYAPRAYGWWVSQRIYRWYGQLRTIEDELDRAGPDADVGAWVLRVEQIHDAVARLSTPLGWSDRVYTLREHVQLVRNELERHRRAAEARSAAREATSR